MVHRISWLALKIAWALLVAVAIGLTAAAGVRAAGFTTPVRLHPRLSVVRENGSAESVVSATR
jgi:hypothetical protein